MRSDQALAETYDVVMLDLDGVVYVGGEAVPSAPEALAGARGLGARLAFITNNASRSAPMVAAHLADLGIGCTAEDVVTSSQAAARVLLARHGVGARVAILGGSGLRDSMAAAGLVPVEVTDEAAAIVSGYGPDVAWHEVMSAAVRIRNGMEWVAANADMSISTPDGLAPGHGVQVEMLSRFTGVTPAVAGKPAQPLFDETLKRTGATRPIMVGDRLDTDIEGAARAGIDSLLVLTGVTGLAELVAAPPTQRPTYISPDLTGLTRPHPVPQVAGPDGAALGGWHGRIDHTGSLVVQGSGTVDDWWRLTACLAWTSLDATGHIVEISGLESPG